jgi:2,3-bisphosphoglycerate-independent phosphoglycerate mutase
MEETGTGRIATVSGRYYAMDRDNRWERVERAYDAMTSGLGERATGPIDAVETAYARGETDEFVLPTVIEEGGARSGAIADGDGVLFFNFRGDRARELARAFTDSGFDGFERKAAPSLAGFACMTEYDARLGLPVLFSPQKLENLLGEVLANKGIRQFRVSETEKYAHITFFFNGGRDEPFEGEDRLLIPSPRDVATYDLKPEMRAPDIADAAVEKLASGDYSFMLMNFANGDMVGHTGMLEATVAACRAVDDAVGRVVDAALDAGWSVIVTSDHGNAEEMFDDETNEVMTAHSTNPVPFILVDNELKGVSLAEDGGLKDVTPTVLKVMGLEQPEEMNGEPLF